MARARRGVENEYLRMDHDDDDGSVSEDEEEDLTAADETDPVTPVIDYDEEAEEEARKLSEAEELLRSARERMKTN